MKGDELPQTPGKPNEFLAPELKTKKSGVDIAGFDEYSERWAIGFMVHTLACAIHPLFFLPELSVSVIQEYLGIHKWPKLGLMALAGKNAHFYWHFMLNDLHHLKMQRPDAFATLQRFINAGALVPKLRPSALEWVIVLDKKSHSMPPQIRYCSFCGNSQFEVRKLQAVSSNAFLCDKCLSLSVTARGEIGNKRKRLIYESDFSTASVEWPEGIRQCGNVKYFRRSEYYHVALERPYSVGDFHYYCPLDTAPNRCKITVLAGLAPDFVARCTDEAFYGIVFRVTNTSYYVFAVSRCRRYWLFSHTEERSGPLIKWTFSDLINKEDEFNSLQLELAGNTIIMSVNERTVASAVNSHGARSPGGVGVCVGSLAARSCPEARFCDFRVFEGTDIISITP